VSQLVLILTSVILIPDNFAFFRKLLPRYFQGVITLE